MLRSLTLAALAIASISAAELSELTFGIIATESTQGLKKDWEPVRADLEKSIGMPVKLFFAPDYSGVIEAMRFNKVQMGWFGNKSAIDVVDRASGEVFCQIVKDDGSNGYYSLIVVHKDSPITTLDELLAKGKELTFSMGDPQSTSGTLIPGYFAFAKNGVDPFKHFKACKTGNHESNALTVAAKMVDAATFNSEAMYSLERKHADKAGELKVVWKSGLIASDPLCWRTDLDAGIKTKVKSFFLSYGNDEAQKAILKPMQMSGFKDSSNRQLVPYRHLALLKDKTKLEADEKIPSSEKAAKLADLSKRIADIEAQLAQ